MFPTIFTIGNFSLSTFAVFYILAVFSFIFLFWRAGKHELVDSEFIFDITAVAISGAVIFSRIFDFVLQPDFYQWSFYRLIFFHIWPGFNFYGALFGALLFGAIFLRSKKPGFWYFFDLAAAPLIFSLFIYNLGVYLGWEDQLQGNSILGKLPIAFYLVVFYFVIFWVIKRLAGRIRHVGFFACFYLVLSSIFVVLLLVLSEFSILQKYNESTFFSSFLFPITLPVPFLLFGSISWYILARRNLINDFKAFSAFALLSSFKIKRIITTIREANDLSRSIVLLPYYLAKGLYLLIIFILKEVLAGFADFVHVLGIKR